MLTTRSSRLTIARLATGIAALLPVCASAQEPAWSVHGGVGLLFPTSRTGTANDIYTGVRVPQVVPLLTLGLIRRLDCCLEAYVSAAVPAVPIDLYSSQDTVDAGWIAPISVQIGVNYRLTAKRATERMRQWFYVTPFLSLLASDRSRVVRVDSGKPGARFETASFRANIGAGAGIGWRFRVTENFGWDANTKWQLQRIPIGEQGLLRLDPFTLTVGLVARLN